MTTLLPDASPAADVSRATALALAVAALEGRPLQSADSDVVELVEQRARTSEIRSAILSRATPASRRRRRAGTLSRRRPYVIRGTRTLENQFDITDPDVLAHVESLFAFAASVRILRGLGGVHPELSAIHTILFCDVYPWAGQVRTVDLVRSGHAFLPARHVEDRLADLERPAEWIPGLGPADDAATAGSRESATGDSRGGPATGDAHRTAVADGLAAWFSAAARVHPFRAGNLRAAVLTAACAAEIHGFRVDPGVLDPGAFRAAAHTSATRHRYESAAEAPINGLFRTLVVDPS